MTISLGAVEAGHEFEPFSVNLSAERSAAYRAATGDPLAVYEDESALPPLAVAALSLGVLLESVGLPAGTLHTNEFVRAHQKVPAGSDVECRARVAQRSIRGGKAFVVLESEIALSGAPAVTTRATVVCDPEAS